MRTSDAERLRSLLFRQLSRSLRQRWDGRALPMAPDWICPQAVDAIAMPLHRGPLDPASWELQLAVRDGIPGRSLPSAWTLSPSLPPLRLRAVRSAPARAQGGLAPGVRRATAPETEGTATCLLRDRLNPSRHYVLTCGHVLAPDRRVAWGDRVPVSAAGQEYDGLLREWQPAPDLGIAPATIDAGLVELDVAAVGALRQQAGDWIPQRVGHGFGTEREVQILRYDGQPIDGVLKAAWSGRVELPGGAAGHAYLLEDAIGYLASSAMRPGDSGAPVWSREDELLGMHIGAIDAESASGANAVLGRIAPVLDWYCVKAFTREDPATVADQPRPTQKPRLPAPPQGLLLGGDTHERTILAKTLWGEARGEGQAGQQAVACVILNRARRKYRGDSVSAVCRWPSQFSCWNANDPNRALLDRLDPAADAAYATALAVADLALTGRLDDPTRGALHYHAR